MRTPISLVAIGLWGLLSVATAQEYCVTCTGPDANYRCIIGGAVPPAGPSSRGQLLCITELAKSGGHASCSAGRKTDAACPGEVRTVMFPQTPVDPNAPPVAGGPPPGAQGLQAPQGAPGLQDGQTDPMGDGSTAAVPPDEAPAPDEKGPSTVADLTKKTIDKTGEGMEKAGNAIGKAAKKTWNCLSSFFGDC